MSAFSGRHCTACTRDTPKLSPSEVQGALAEVSGFELSRDGAKILRRFEFEEYGQTMAFVNAVAFIAQREDHHPDLEVSYGSCTVTYSTHAVNGLSENDFICAAKVNALLE